eukprot:EG_transcript_61602
MPQNVCARPKVLAQRKRFETVEQKLNGLGLWMLSFYPCCWNISSDAEQLHGSQRKMAICPISRAREKDQLDFDMCVHILCSKGPRPRCSPRNCSVPCFR